jgi:hypothetical protein
MPEVVQVFTCYGDPNSPIEALLTAYPACGHTSLPGSISGTVSCSGPPGSCEAMGISRTAVPFSLNKSLNCSGIATYSNPAFPFYILYQLCLTEYEDGSRTGQLGFGPSASGSSSQCDNDTFTGATTIYYGMVTLSVSVTSAS